MSKICFIQLNILVVGFSYYRLGISVFLILFNRQDHKRDMQYIIRFCSIEESRFVKFDDLTDYDDLSLLSVPESVATRCISHRDHFLAFWIQFLS